ncbi:hypothetical protein [Blastococcus sp. SYSU D00813]
MTTDRELDARLAAAAGIRDADLPALPAAFLDELRAEEAAAAAEPAPVVAARRLVADAAAARTAPGGRRRRPGRRALIRAGAGLLALAAAWTTAVVVDGPAGDPPPGAQPGPSTDPSRSPARTPLDPPGGLILVAAEAVAFPYSLDPAPEGLTPVLVRSGGLEVSGAVEQVVHSARYASADDPGFVLSVSAEDPRQPPPGAQAQPPYSEEEVEERGTLVVDGVPADFVSATLATPDCRYAPATPTQEEGPATLCSDAYAEIVWQRPDGLWVGVAGEGDRYGQVPALVAVAESLVDRPQPVALQFGLAPAGWVVSSYESPANLTLVSAADATSPSERVGLSVQERWRGYETADDVVRGMAGGNPVEAVTVDGRPAALVSVPDPFAAPDSGRRTWYLGAGFPDGGPLFLFQAPDSLTREDVLAMAEEVTYTP